MGDKVAVIAPIVADSIDDVADVVVPGAWFTDGDGNLWIVFEEASCA